MANQVVYILELRDRYTRAAERIARATKNMEHRFQKTMHKLDNFTKRLRVNSKQLQKYGRDIRSAGTDMTLGMTLPLGIAGAAALKTTARFEQMEVAIGTLAESRAHGAKLMTDLKTFAAKTPFQMGDVMSGATRMLGANIPSADIVGHLTSIGNVAAGTGANINEMIRTFIEVKQLGHASSIELKELARRGLNLRQILFDMGKGAISMEQINKAIEQKGMTFEVMLAALDEVNKKGGKFHNMMIIQSKTLGGVWSNFNDSLDFTLDRIGRTVVESTDLKATIVSLSDSLGRAGEKFAEFAQEHPTITKYLILFVGLLAILGPVVIVIGQLTLGIGGLMALIGAMSAGVSLLAGAFNIFAIAAWAAALPMGIITGPILLIVGAVGLVIAALVLLWVKWDEIWNAIGAGVNAVAFAFGVEGSIDPNLGKPQQAPAKPGSRGAGRGNRNTIPDTSALAAGGGAHDTIDVNLNAPPGTVESVRVKRTNSRGNRNKSKLKVGENATR